jgi:uncharacterized protein (TIGR02246 family)
MGARTPEDCDRLFAEHVNAGNLDGVVGLYEPGASLLQQDGSVVIGKSAIREALSGLISAGARFRMNVTRTILAGDDLAVLYNDWTMTAGGNQMQGKALEVVRRQPDGTWLYAIDDPFVRG